jgi:hypothetical protein
MLKYKGGGFIPDVPARDLTDDEATCFGGASLLVSTGLYDMEQPKVKREASKAEVTDGS